MTADVELLPLPGWAHKADKLLCDTDWLRTQVSDYARACVAHATAAKDAEIESLQEQLDWTVEQNDRLLDEGRKLTASAERLAEALREVMLWIENWSPPFTEDDEWPDTEAKAKAALHPTAAQENDDA